MNATRTYVALMSLLNRSVDDARPTTLNDMEKANEVLKKEREQMVRHLILLLYECTSIL